jgi:type I restriction enzyme S subunit
VPPLVEQRAIAGVLGALDDKIESNRRIASTCESLARVLLEVELAGSSEAVPVGSAARFRNRERKPLSASQRAEMLGKRVYPYFGATGVFDYVDDYLFDDLTVLVGEDGSVVNDDGSPVVQLAWGKYWVNNHAHVLVGEGIATELLYIALKRSDVRPLVTGAVQAKISMGNLRTLQLELPPPDERTALGVELQLILGRLRRALDETAVLEVTRDALLPELLSGRLRVREVEEMVGSV